MAAMLRPGSRNVARAMSPGQSPNLCCGARCVGGCVIDPPTQHVTGGTPDCRASIRPWFSSARVGTDCTANRFASAGAASTSTSASLSAPARSAASWIRAGPRCGRGRTSWSTRNVGKPEAATPPTTRAVDHIDVDHLDRMPVGVDRQQHRLVACGHCAAVPAWARQLRDATALRICLRAPLACHYQSGPGFWTPWAHAVAWCGCHTRLRNSTQLPHRQ